jgi:uncharacterized repeat protein (TIGR01451 family)
MKRKLLLTLTLLFALYFGHSQVVANQPPDLSGCFQVMEEPLFDLTVQTPVILGDQDPALYTVAYFDFFGDPEANTEPIENPAEYYASTAVPSLNLIYARVTKISDGSYAITSFNVENISLVSMIDAMVDCDGYHMPSNNIGHFYTGPNGTGEILDGTVVTSVIPIYFHAEYNGCVIDFEDQSWPEILPFTGPLTPLTGCDNDMDGIATFDLSSKIPEALMGVQNYPNDVTFHLTMGDAENGSNAILNITLFVNTVPFTQIVYVRKTYANTCETVTSMELVTSTCAGNSVSGSVAYNFGTNECTTNAVPIPNIPIKLVEGEQVLYAYSNTLGNYEFNNVPNGNYTLTPELGSSLPYTVSPSSYSATVPASSTGNNFCLTTPEPINNVMVSMIPLGSAQPGFAAGYYVYIYNDSVLPASGQFTVTYNNLAVVFTSAVPAGVQNGSAVTFTYNLESFEDQYIYVSFTLLAPPVVNQGDILQYWVSLDGQLDDNATDDVAVLNQTVVNSFDPNDIAVHEGEFITEEQADDYLHYTIRFQNTGNANATFIRIEATLDENLDWSTFVPLTASHAYFTSRNDDVIEIMFDNIQLPGSEVYEPGSHGYVTYRVKPKATIALGEQISATANIFFDYNLPITTNTVTTTVQNAMGIEALSASTFVMYPNPAADSVTLRLGESSGKAKVEVADVLGKVVLSTETTRKMTTINTSFLSAGMYFVTVTSGEATSNQKLVIR